MSRKAWTCIVLSFALLFTALGAPVGAQERSLPDPSKLQAGDPEGKKKALDRIAQVREDRLQMAEPLVLAAPFYDTSRGEADLLLLNRFSEPIDFEVRLRTAQGAVTSLGFHRAEPLRYHQLSLDEMVASLPRGSARGSLDVEFLGDQDMFQGWLVLRRDEQVVEFPLELVKEATNPDRMAFWDLESLPSGFEVVPRFYLSNHGEAAVSVEVEMGRHGQARSRTLRLGPGVQKVMSVPVRGEAWEQGWVKISTPEDAHGLMAWGVLDGEDFLARLPLNGGAALSVATDLHAVNVPLWVRGEGQAVYPRQGVAGVFNANSSPLEARVELLSNQGSVLAALEQTLQPREIVSVDLAALLVSESLGTVPQELRLRIRSKAGGLLANGLVFDAAGSPVELELARAEDAHFSGIYPLPSLADHEVTTTLVNVGQENARVVAHITWQEGEYAFGPVEIASGASFQLDLAALAALGEPDLVGRTLDPEYSQAFLQWTVQGQGSRHLLGRTQVQPRFGVDSFGFNCHGCCEESPWGELIPGSVLFPAGGSSLFEACEYIGTCTTILGPYPASISQLNYSSPLSWNGTTASSNSATAQMVDFEGWGAGVEFDGYGECTPFDEVISDDGEVCVIKVSVTSISLSSNQIQVNLDADGDTSKSGTLTVTLKNPSTKEVFNGTKSAGNHTINLNRDSLPTGHEYNQVEAKWVVNGQTAMGTKSYRFKVLGSYSNTRYNTPTESSCSGSNTAVCYTSGGCTSATNSYSTTNMKSGFISEVAENGSGSSSALSFVSREWLFSPPGTLTCSSVDMRDVSSPCPACGGTLSANADVAISASNPNLSCGDRVYVSNEGERTVRDHGGGLSNTQLDHYTGASGCNAEGGSIGSRKVFKLF